MSDESGTPKAKVTLHRVQRTMQETTGVRPAIAENIAAVEARWRAENERLRAARLRSALTGMYAWLAIVFVLVCAIWYFLGEDFLPARYAYPNVQRNALRLWDMVFGEKPKEDRPRIDPVDAATLVQRREFKASICLLEKVCLAAPPLQDDYDLKKMVAEAPMKILFGHLAQMDMAYKKSLKKLNDMLEENERLERKRPTEMVHPNRKYIEQKGSKELALQRKIVAEARDACARTRIRATEDILDTVRKQSVKWTGPDGRNDRQALLDKVARMLHKYKLSEIPWTEDGQRSHATTGHKGGQAGLQTLKAIFNSVNEETESVGK